MRYRIICLVLVPCVIVIFLDLQPMKASTVANHSLPRIKGCPPRLVLGCMTLKYIRYSHDSSETFTSSKIPSSLSLDRPVSSNIVGVGRIFGSLNWFNCYNFITFMVSPKSIRVFVMGVPLINIVTTRFPGSTYFSTMISEDTRLENFPTTWIVGGSFFHLPRFLMHKSITILAYMGMPFIACIKGILIQIFFSSDIKSNLDGIIDFSSAILSRKGG
jgi:hypothetical protein